ncbi:restriction endonuclease subunit S [Leyella stercorea]|uniref:Restriction endonuclease subunit S n=1 Tax=Leyella stercorea TaxID=363265 RepID=A0A3R6FML5_9BACT|nr:restriction endonuclease subunit S [Leyella stercorea]
MTTTINNEHKKLNVPNLRFPEFQGEWEEYTLQDVVTFSNGKAHENCVNDDGDYILVNSKFVSTNGQVQKRVTSQLSPLHKSQFVMVMSDLPNGKALAKCFYVEEDNKYTLNQRVCSFTSNDGNVSRFLMYQINRNKYYLRFDDGINQTNLKKSEVLSCPVFIPIVREQEKIATLLCKIDERIATQNKIIEDLKKLKSAISHILFSSKGAIHLSEIANVVMGQSPSSNAYNDQGLGMPLVQGNLDISNGKTTPRLYTAEFNQTTEKGNIILTVRAPVGEVAKATQKVCLGRGVCAIIPHEENMSDFIYQYLTFYKFMWRRYEQGSTFTSINGSDVRNIFCPKVRNVSILTLLDIKINIEERVVKQYQSQKQYMLYQMFI